MASISNWHQTISNGSNEKSTELANCSWDVDVAAAAAAVDVDVAALYACNERDRLQFQRLENKVGKARGSKLIGATMLQTHRSNISDVAPMLLPHFTGPDD